MIKVLIIDDSAVTRSVLQRIINSDPEIEVVGTAIDPIIAAKKIQVCQPDVITLDLEMPRMDGLTFLKKLMIGAPTPVIVISGQSAKASHNAIKALEYGAMEIIEKPDLSSPEKLSEVSDNICSAIKAAANAKLSGRPIIKERVEEQVPTAKKASNINLPSAQLCVIGSSTGGPEVLREILQSVHASTPGIVVAQHMPAMFTSSFAERLNVGSQLMITEAVDGNYIRKGEALIIPGDKHGVIRKDANGYYIELNSHDKVNRHRPSVDVLFNSAAETLGGKALGILLTGMGEDGARGLQNLSQRGAHTIAQSSESCVVFGMPRRAIELGAAKEILNPTEIINRLNELKR